MKSRLIAALAAAQFLQTFRIRKRSHYWGAWRSKHRQLFPFGCSTTTAPFTWIPQYQQVYNSALFPGPMTINSLRFFHTQGPPDDGSLNAGTFVISLSTTSKAVNGLDIVNLANNLGPDNTQVFNASLPPFATSFFDIFLSTPFNYDPSGGNLLLDVFSADADDQLTLSFFDFHDGTFGNNSSRAYVNDLGLERSTGLVTGFNVPEPSTLIVLGIGLLGAAAARRRKPAA